MTDFNKKILVSVIKKLADDGDGLGDVWTGGGGGTGTRQPAGGGGGGNPAISDMQKKMIQLGNSVQSQMKVEDMAKMNQPQKPGDQPTATPEATEAAGRDSFSDFMAKMMRGTGAQEFNPDPKATQVDQKKPSSPSRMWVFMDTVKRIGNAKAEIKPDGVWGPRTNQSLLNVHAFAGALLQLAASFEVPIKSYSQQNLEEFVVPRVDTEISQQDKVKSAPIIGEHLDAINQAFQEFRDGVLENPHFQTYIEDDTPFATIGGPPKQPGQDQGQQPALIGPEEAQEINKYFPTFTISFTGPNGAPQTKTMSVTPLITLQALEAWKKQNGVTMNNRDILTQVRTQVTLEPKPYEYTPPPASKKNRGMSGAVNVKASKR
jgi:hypothetical protein